MCVAGVALSDQAQAGGRDDAESESPRPIELSDLPSPPDWIDHWIKTSQVKLSYGGREPPNRLIKAETTYRMLHRYRSSPRWTIVNRGPNRICVIRLRFRSLNLLTTHEVWFLKKPQTEGFWSDRLVLHELDHVRLSADPRLARRFVELVREESQLKKVVPVGVSVTNAVVKKWVDDHVQQQFKRVSDLASIRYRELDRLTRHGQDPIPEDSEIARAITELQENVGKN